MTQTSYIFLAGVSVTVLTVVTACGVVGSPVAPENVGVNPTITRQKIQLQKSGTVQRADNTSGAAVPLEPVEPKGQDEELPPLRPVGTR
ncbi:hypothetical protein [Nitrospira lenta]|uniref:Uncharacterized protein n=1 Tax=Nitrospira lenta TaxID=1436998 RepID=A0A330L3J9_9BACT|nr:hypothetical protein [Nitrospira lenta]SPP63867.1 conserved exported hypothetical protein [Nitrospira lenta]